MLLLSNEYATEAFVVLTWILSLALEFGKTMDGLQIVSSAAQIISSMVGAISALDQASRDIDEAPKRIQGLEELMHGLDNLVHEIKRQYAYRLHNHQLDYQIQTLNSLIGQLRPKISKAKEVVSQSKYKNRARVILHSMTGDPLAKVISSIKNDLNQWIEFQKLIQNAKEVIESTARDVPFQLKIKADEGYPKSSKCTYVKNLFEQEGLHRIVLIVGLSGIGKSCLARQVASDPPARFIDGALEIKFGHWCSRAACNGNKAEYQRRLARKFGKFLVQLGFWKKLTDEYSGDLEYICVLLQKALNGKSMLLLLDDVWEQDIVERFAKLYDNECRYLVTTRNEAVYEITEAEKVELGKDDVREISKAILLYHSLLSEDQLPSAAEKLLDRCGHHPLTIAVIGKALRKELRADKWERAITDLSTLAKSAPGPVQYVNEKEAENTLTIFGSFEFSLEAMSKDARQLFVALAALSWAETIPEVCLEAIWSVIGHDSMFSLTICKLVEGSLLIKSDSDPSYQVHDMVSLYLDGKITDSIKILLEEPLPEASASICPWLLAFGKEGIKEIATRRMESCLTVLEENETMETLEATIQALMASKSISELEASRATFCSLLGPRIPDLISSDSLNLIAVSAEAITNMFSMSDYFMYFPALESTCAVDKLIFILGTDDDLGIQAYISIILAKLAEIGSRETVAKVLECIPFDKIAELLSPEKEDWHDRICTMLMSLTKSGKYKAVERMFACDIDGNLIKLLEDGSEVAQHHAIVTLKAIYELAGTNATGTLQSANLNRLPWEVRLPLEGLTYCDHGISSSSRPDAFPDIIAKLLGNGNEQVLESIQALIPIIEKAGNPITRDMILESQLIKRLSELLDHGKPERMSIRSGAAFLLMKLACTGGGVCVNKFLEYDVVHGLIKMMQCPVPELQDLAYEALHHMMFSNSGVDVLNKIFEMDLVDRLVHLLESKSVKTREVGVHCILDVVELGNKGFLERMVALQVVEKLVKLEKSGGASGNSFIGFLKGMDKCKNLSAAERRVLKQQVLRRAKTHLKGKTKLESRLLAAINACITEGSSGIGGRHKKP